MAVIIALLNVTLHKNIIMKKIVYLGVIFLFLNFYSCSTEVENNEEELSEWKCGTHNGKQLWTGPRGGCYYYNSNGNKTYVERSECDC